MAAEIDIQIKTLAVLEGINQTNKELLNLKKNATEAGKGATSGFASASNAAKSFLVSLGPLALAAAVVAKAVSLIPEAIAESSAAEKALQDLTTALEGTGQATNSVLEDFDKFAKQIELTTKFGDDLVISQLAVAKNFGLTNEQAKKLVETATDLSAVTGQDLQKSTEDLLKTYAGQLPRELKILGREFNNLTEAQLKNGDALDLINSKFGTRAESQIKTFSGSIAQLGNTFGNFLESIGDTITKSDTLISVISGLSNGLKVLGGIETDQEKLKRLNEELDKTGGAIRRIILQDKIIEIEAKIKGDSLSKAFAEVDDQIKNAKLIAGKGIDVPVVLDEGRKQKFLDDIKKLGLDSIQIAKQERDEKLKLAAEIFGGEATLGRLSIEDKRLYTDSKLKIEKEYNKKVSDEQKKAQKENEDSARKSLQTFNEAKQNVAKGLEQFFKTGNKQAFGGAVAGIGQAVTQGAGGARSLLGSAAQLGGNSLAPGVGDAIAPIIQELSKGKDAAKAFVTEFLNSIPDMITGLVEGIVAAADTFAEKVPEIIDRLISQIPRVIESLAESMPRVAISLSQQMPTVAITFATSLIEQAPAIAQAIVKAVGNAPGNAAKSVGKIFGFAEGGSAFAKLVPGSGSGDTFPALLTPGELVVDRSTAFKLKDFLNSKDGPTSNGQSENANNNEPLLRALSAPIILNIDGREIARAVRKQVSGGFVLAV